jgi:hypothetical protein
MIMRKCQLLETALTVALWIGQKNQVVLSSKENAVSIGTMAAWFYTSHYSVSDNNGIHTPNRSTPHNVIQHGYLDDHLS